MYFRVVDEGVIGGVHIPSNFLAMVFGDSSGVSGRSLEGTMVGKLACLLGFAGVNGDEEMVILYGSSSSPIAPRWEIGESAVETVVLICENGIGTASNAVEAGSLVVLNGAGRGFSRGSGIESNGIIGKWRTLTII